MPTFEAWQTTGDAITPPLSPPRLRNRFGLAWNKVLGAVKDVIAASAGRAVTFRLVDQTSVDALPFIGSERLIERYPLESDTSYRGRLRAAWDTWLFAGTSQGIIAGLAAAGFSAVIYLDTDSAPPDWAGAWPPTEAVSQAASAPFRFHVLLTEPFPYVWLLRRWGDGSSWGGIASDGTPYTWGSTASAAQVSLVRRIIRKWKPAHERCGLIMVRLPDGSGGHFVLKWAGEAN